MMGCLLARHPVASTRASSCTQLGMLTAGCIACGQTVVVTTSVESFMSGLDDQHLECLRLVVMQASLRKHATTIGQLYTSCASGPPRLLVQAREVKHCSTVL
eukprot:4058546-Amphidinium_carterae.1